MGDIGIGFNVVGIWMICFNILIGICICLNILCVGVIVLDIVINGEVVIVELFLLFIRFLSEYLLVGKEGE